MNQIENTGKKNITDILALTPMQEGMLFHYLKSPDSSRYVEQLALQISGEIDLQIITEAWNIVIESNEMLRASFRWEKVKSPVQVILKDHHLNPEYYDLTTSPGGEREKLAAEIKIAERNKKFDLRKPPFRITICRMDQNKAEMIITNHHILYDGWSNGILLKEFFSVYNDRLAHRDVRKFSKSEFKDFLKWIRERQNKEEQESFWKNYLLAGRDMETPGLPSIRKRIKRRQIVNIGQYLYKFPTELSRQLETFTKQHKITLSSLLTVAWGILLQKYQQVEDVIFDTTVSGRSARIKGIEDIVGMFINTLPMRVQTLPGERISDLLDRQYAGMQQRETYENTPLTDINEYVEISSFRDKEKKLFDSVLVLENYPLDKQLMQENGKLTVDSYSVSGMTQYDITLIITIFDDIELNITFNKDLFDEDSLNRLSGHFTDILAGMLGYPLETVAKIAVNPSAEREMLLERLAAMEESGAIEETPYVAPRDTLEKKLAQVWAEVLNVERRDEYHKSIGIDDNFFDFGGHSLKATLLSARIHRDFDVKISLEEIFKNPTIAQLAHFIRESSPGAYGVYEDIKPAQEKGFYMLSSVQQRMYALQQLDPDSTAYNVTAVMETGGEVDGKVISMFQTAFVELIRRHEILRTSFHLVNGEPMQKIHEPGEIALAIEYEDLEVRGDSLVGEAQQPAFNIRNFIRPFDLSRVPLIRVKLVKYGTGRHWLILSMHHIITDGFSMNIFVEEFGALCRGETLPVLKKQYKDFSEWQYNRLQSGKLKEQSDYWLNEFSGELPVLNMLTDYPRPLVQQFEGDRVHFVLDKEITRQLHRLARQSDATLFMILLTAFNILLYRYTGQEDMIIGTTVAGRSHPGLESMIGLFIETLALRNNPSGDKTFESFLSEVRSRTLAGYDNEAYPFKELIKKIGDAGEMSRNPLFDVMLIVQNVEIPTLELEGLTFTPIPYYSKESKLDMTLEAVEIEGELKFHIEYSTALFKSDTIERLAGHYVNILKEVVLNPGIRIAEIEILGLEEKHLILEDFRWSHWNPEPGKYPFDKRIEEIFVDQVSQTPDNIAVVYEDQHITYRQLNERANSISKIIEEL
ncbi:MAG TPA: condensation domain-containing protein [Candidatus Deferrimicrobium sp.]|nr:condensation domain-containing protein [Candidatus Deferrimicrobium sp.]